MQLERWSSNVDDLLTWGAQYLRGGAMGHLDLSQSRFAVNDQGLGLGVIVFAAGVARPPASLMAARPGPSSSG